MTNHVKALLLTTALLFAACGREEPARSAELAAEAPAPAAGPLAFDAPAAAASADRGTGTLRLGKTTYRFTVRACDFSV